MNKLNPCPYLRVKNDPDTWAAYPSRANQCHHAWPHQSVAPLYQQNICLTNAHQSCPIFKREGLWPGRLPSEVRSDAAYEAAIKKQGTQVIVPTVVEPVEGTAAENAPAAPAPKSEDKPKAEAPPEIKADVPPVAEPPPLEPVPDVIERISPARKIEMDKLPEPSGDFSPVEGKIEAVSPGKIAAEVRSGERPKPPSGRPDKVVYSKAERERHKQEAKARALEAKTEKPKPEPVPEPAQKPKPQPEPKPKQVAPPKPVVEKPVKPPKPARPPFKVPRRLLLMIGGIIGAIALCSLLGFGAAMIARGIMNAPPAPTATATEVTAQPTATLDVTATTGAVASTPTIEPTATTAAATTVQISVQETRMRFDGNLRSGPGTDFDLIGEVAAGANVSVFGRDELGVWLAIRLVTGQEGWIPASQVNTDSINVLSAPVSEATFAPVGTPSP